MADIGGAIIGKVGVEVFKRASPHALAYFKNQFFGKTILFIGPSRAGKTSFINFMKSGNYAEPTDFMARTQTTKSAGRLQLSTKNGNLQIEIRQLIDSKGQDSPEAHADLVGKYRPHAICLLIDSSSEWAPPGYGDSNRHSRAWFEQFLMRLSEVREEYPHCTRRLKSFCVLLNKWDLVDDETVFNSRKRQIELILSQNLKGSATRICQIANIKQLSLIENHRDGALPPKALLSILNPFLNE